MKQLTKKQHKELLDLGYSSGNTIPDMIEFLGDDLTSMIFIGSWLVCLAKSELVFNERELCDTLWEAVKYKLNNL